MFSYYAREAMPVKEAVKKKIKTKKKDSLQIEESHTAELDPRKIAFAAAYLDPLSPTYSNALQSALKAGFAQEYAEKITAPSQRSKWLSEIIGKQTLLDIAKKNLQRDLTVDINTYTTKGRGKDKVKVKLGINSKVMKNVQDATFFVLEKLDPDYKPVTKDTPPPVKVDIKQIIIIAPNGEQVPYSSSNTEAVSSVPKTS